MSCGGLSKYLQNYKRERSKPLRGTKNLNLKKIWLAKIKRDDGLLKPKNCYVCSDHFIEEDFKQDIQVCVFLTFLKTESYVYLSHIQNVFFFPRIFPEHFPKAVFIIILKRQRLFVKLRITVKKVFSSLGINKSTMRKTISM